MFRNVKTGMGGWYGVDSIAVSLFTNSETAATHPRVGAEFSKSSKSMKVELPVSWSFSSHIYHYSWIRRRQSAMLSNMVSPPFKMITKVNHVNLTGLWIGGLLIDNLFRFDRSREKSWIWIVCGKEERWRQGPSQRARGNHSWENRGELFSSVWYFFQEKHSFFWGRVW